MTFTFQRYWVENIPTLLLLYPDAPPMMIVPFHQSIFFCLEHLGHPNSKHPNILGGIHIYYIALIFRKGFWDLSSELKFRNFPVYTKAITAASRSAAKAVDAGREWQDADEGSKLEWPPLWRVWYVETVVEMARSA